MRLFKSERNRPIKLLIYQDMPHGVLNFDYTHGMKEAEIWVNDSIEVLRKLLYNNWIIIIKLLVLLSIWAFAAVDSVQMKNRSLLRDSLSVLVWPYFQWLWVHQVLVKFWVCFTEQVNSILFFVKKDSWVVVELMPKVIMVFDFVIFINTATAT